MMKMKAEEKKKQTRCRYTVLHADGVSKNQMNSALSRVRTRTTRTRANNRGFRAT